MAEVKHKPNWIPIDIHESAELMKHATGGRVYRAGFGSGGVAIDAAIPANRWMLLILARMRGVVEEHGSGI